MLPADIDDWTLLDHCGARTALERDGWRFTGAGDWAVVLGDRTGRYAARISPFERAYQYFVGVCRRHPDSRWLPTIYAATDLAGGGQLTVMELLTPRQVPDGDDPDPVWSSDDSDLAVVRADIERTYAACKENVRWWGSLDVKPAHFMLGPDDQLKLVDPFGLVVSPAASPSASSRRARSRPYVGLAAKSARTQYSTTPYGGSLSSADHDPRNARHLPLQRIVSEAAGRLQPGDERPWHGRQLGDLGISSTVRVSAKGSFCDMVPGDPDHWPACRS